MQISDFGENMKVIRSDLVKRSNLKVNPVRTLGKPDTPFSTKFQLATANTRVIFPILDLRKSAKSIAIRSDQDIEIQVNDDRDYPEEAQNKKIFVYANTPITFDTNLWKLSIENTSGSTANIRIYATSEITKVEGV